MKKTPRLRTIRAAEAAAQRAQQGIPRRHIPLHGAAGAGVLFVVGTVDGDRG